ncbi:hypothetical protein ABK040_016452 [Willaertia magna]
MSEPEINDAVVIPTQQDNNTNTTIIEDDKIAPSTLDVAQHSSNDNNNDNNKEQEIIEDVEKQPSPSTPTITTTTSQVETQEVVEEINNDNEKKTEEITKPISEKSLSDNIEENSTNQEEINCPTIVTTPNNNTKNMNDNTSNNENEKQRSRSLTNSSQEHPPISTLSSIFPIDPNFIDLKTGYLPKDILLNVHELGNVSSELRFLEPHLQYAYQHFIKQELCQVERKHQFIRNDLELDLEELAKVGLPKERKSTSSSHSTGTSPASITSSLSPFSLKRKSEEGNLDYSPNTASVSSSVLSSSVTTRKPTISKLGSRSHSVLLTSSNNNTIYSNILPENEGQGITNTSPHSLDKTEYLGGTLQNATEHDVDDEEEDEEDDLNNVNDVTTRIASVFSPFFKTVSYEEEKCLRFAPAYPFQPDQSKKILVSVQELVLTHISDVSPLEPLFCSLYLYDMKQRTRISEEFYFSLNTDQALLKTLGIEKIFPKELLSNQRRNQAVFTINEVNENVYYVLWIRRVFSDGTGNEIYSHKKRVEASEKSSLQEKIKQLYSYLDAFRTPILCAFEPLFKPSTNSLLPSDNMDYRMSIQSVAPKVVSPPKSPFIKRATSLQQITRYELRRGIISFHYVYPIPHSDGKKQRFDINSLIEGQRDSDLKRQLQTTTKSLDGHFAIRVEELTLESLEEMFYGNNGIANALEKKEFYEKIEKGIIKPKGLRDEIESEELFHSLLSKFHQVVPLYSTSIHGTKIINTRNSISISPSTSTGSGGELQQLENDEISLRTSNESEDEISAYEDLVFTVPRIHLHFNHILYLLLDSCDFSSLPSSCKSVCVRILLRDNDETDSSSLLLGLNSIFTEGSRNFQKEHRRYALSSVTFHERQPQFFDQIKIQLPIPLTENHHLVFEFRHISCKKKKNNNDSGVGRTESQVVGYSILNILEEGIVSGSEKKLPVYKSLLNGYMRKDVKKQMDCYNGGKGIFKLSVIPKTSLYPQDKNATAFLYKSSTILPSSKSPSRSPSSPVSQSDDSRVNSPPKLFLNELTNVFKSSEIEELLKTFQKTNWKSILRHAPSYFNLLFYILCNIKSNNISGTVNCSSPTATQSHSLFRAGSTSSIKIANYATGFLTGRRKPTSPSVDNKAEDEYQIINYAFDALIRMLDGLFKESIKKISPEKDSSERDNFLYSYLYYLFTNPPTKINFPALICDLYAEHLAFYMKRKSTHDEKSNDNGLSSPQEEVANNNEGGGNLRASRRFSSFFKKTPNMSPTTETEREVEDLTVIQGLKFSWFFFDLIMKSIKLHLIEKNTAILSKQLFEKIRGLQRRFVECLLDQTVGASEAHMELVRSMNRNLALFACDLLDISFLPEVKDNLDYKKFLRLFLTEYSLAQFTSSPGVVFTLKFDFVEMLLDYDMFVEVNLLSDTPYLLRFVIGVLQKGNKPELRERIVKMIYRFVTKLDYSNKYQSLECRNEISKLLQPFFFEISQVDRLLKGLDNNLQIQYAIAFTHTVRNKNIEEWNQYWKGKSVEYIVGFIRLLSVALNSMVSYAVKVVRRAVKMTILDLIQSFLYQEKDTLLQQQEKNYPIIEELMLLFMKFIEQSYAPVNTGTSNSSNGTKKVYDQNITNRKALPLFVFFVKNFVNLNIAGETDTWKIALGTLLGIASHPFCECQELSIKEGIEFLLDLYKEKIEETSQQTEKFVLTPDSAENLVVENGQIKAATLDKLVEKVTNDSDPKFREIFFITYRSFCKSNILMDKLIDRFDQTQTYQDEATKILNTKVALRVFGAFKLWILKFFYDFDNVLVVRLIQFLDRVSLNPEHKQFCNTQRKTIGNKLKDNEKVLQASNYAKLPDAIIPDYIGEHFDIFIWDPLEFARQLTLIEYKFFSKIEPKEFLSGAWGKTSKYELATNIAYLTDRWNKMTQYIACVVLSNDDVKIRKKYITKFIEIADALREIKNFHAVTEILSGLSNVSVHRLKKTWSSLSNDILEKYDKLRELCSQEQANKAMRQALLSSPPPCIPPLSMYLKDLTFINDGNPDITKDGLINVFKRRQVSKVILEIRQYQQASFFFEPVPYLSKVIDQIQTVNDYSGENVNIGVDIVKMDEDQQWETSLRLEPRQ